MARAIFGLAVVAAVVYLIARNVGVFTNVIVVLLGFGAVVMVHEFGHFIVAKLGGIKVEAFSIFMPPTLLGIRKTKAGFKFRVLPNFAGTRDETPAEEAAETEYRIGVFPFGGYVKLLGQEDTGPARQNDDPRSFANKPVRTRIAVISAGVTFNVVSAALIFMTVFLVGINLPPAVVGGVAPNSPAAEAGLQPGDEFVEIAGIRKDLDFSSILIASALSDVNEVVPVTVRHADGSEEQMTLVARLLPGGTLREFGIQQALSLTIAEIAEPNLLEERVGLRPGDRVSAGDGRPVDHYWELEQIVAQTLAPAVSIEAERSTAGGEPERVQTELALDWRVAGGVEIEADSDLNHVYSMIPRLRVTVVGDEPVLSSKTATAPTEAPGLQPGDIIVGLASVENPTYREMREVTTDYENRSLPIRVLRTDANGVEKTVAVSVKPKKPVGSDRVLIGIGVALDAAHPVVAKTVSVPEGPPALDVPRGARITAVNGEPVSSFYELIAEVRRWGGQEVRLEYRLDGDVEGGVTLTPDETERGLAVMSRPAEVVPFKALERQYRADNPIAALGMGCRRTVMFIAQTYVTLKQLISGLVSPKMLMGPVGIISLSYRIVAEQPPIYYVYFLGLISATIAVINFLPVPPFDGGLVVLMLIEKIRGAALSERAQGIVAYAGWVMILALLVYVTFNDIVRTLFS
jgi:regulator of sigma E protease